MADVITFPKKPRSELEKQCREILSNVRAQSSDPREGKIGLSPATIDRVAKEVSEAAEKLEGNFSVSYDSAPLLLEIERIASEVGQKTHDRMLAKFLFELCRSALEREGVQFPQPPEAQ